MSINFNGEILPAGQNVLLASNRAFRYGDSLFESIRVFEGKMPFFDRHWQRIRAGMEVLKFEMPAHFSAAFFQHEISKLTENQGNWRIRLTAFRTGGGLYTPERNSPEFLIETTPMSGSQFELNPEGLTLGIYPDLSLPCHHKHPNTQTPKHTQFKTGNALPNVLAAIFKKEKNWDDCLLLNTAGRIACGSSSNVFLVKNGNLITPPLTEGCVAGTMRGVVLDLCKNLKIKALEAPVSPEDLPQADEMFLTNAVQGIRWVQEVEGSGKQFSNDFSQKIAVQLNASIR